MPHTTRDSWPVLFILLIAYGVAGCSPQVLPTPPAECDVEGVGCLSDEVCVDGKCVLRERCGGDEDCPSAAWNCSFPSQLCELRPGFGEECSATTDCEPGQFCALGICRSVESSRTCARRTDCPPGKACDRQTFLCIDEAPCTLVEDFPEVACDPGEVCDQISERCSLTCQGECTVATESEDCGPGARCDGACRCVQCLDDDDCGPGLVCDARAGRCQSEDLCYDDSDCESPLICDARTALCQVPPPPCASDLDCEIAEICNRTTGICELLGGTCIDDRFENADTPATAEAVNLPVAGETRLLDDLVLCPDDDDVYAFNLAAGDQLVVRVAETRAQARATLWLLDPEGETSLRFANAPPFGNGTIAYVAQEPETVFLRVNALLGQTPYLLEATRNIGAPCGPDAFESNVGNDTPETATPAENVPTDATLLARICRGDVDYLAIDLEEGEGISATLSFDPTAADLDLALVSASTGALLTQSAGIHEPEQVAYRAPFAQTVLVRVQGFGNATAAYALALQRLPPFVCTPDPEEPDDDVAMATLLEPLTSIQGQARTLCAGDRDRYRVPLEDFERVVVDTRFAAADLDVEINVYDETGATLLLTSPDSTDGETLGYDARANETVIVEIRSLLGTRGTYTLDLFRENQNVCAPDDGEPNDTLAEAQLFPGAAASFTLCESDQDWFVIPATAGKRLVAEASFLNADGDLDLMILGVDGMQILAAADGIGNTERAEALVPVDGDYFVRVFALTNGARARYRLQVSVEN